jgi:phage terminase large subunit-like protein
MHVWCLGRRSAKTTTAAIVGLHSCLLSPELDKRVRRGERRYCVAVATNHRQARLFVDAARSIVKASPLLGGLVEGETEDQLVFRNGTVLAAFPCSSRGGRGWPISCLLLDEMGHFLSESEGVHTAERVFGALAPSTAQFGDAARIIVASTPYGEDGLFAQLYQQAANGELTDAVAHRATTAEANPTIDDAFLERERARDPEGFRGEYEAQFVGSGGAFLDSERITDAVADRAELAPEQAVSWVAGLDPAFSSDPFGLALVGRERGHRTRLVLGLARAWVPERRKGASFEERRMLEDVVLDEVADVCRRFRARVVTDQYAAPAIVERLQRAGLFVRAVPMTAGSKTAAFGELRARLYAGSLELYEHPQLLAELRRLRSKYTAGSSTVVNPRVGGSHGDMAQALALACWEHANTYTGEVPEGWFDRRTREPAVTAGLMDRTF